MSGRRDFLLALAGAAGVAWAGSRASSSDTPVFGAPVTNDTTTNGGDTETASPTPTETASPTPTTTPEPSPSYSDSFEDGDLAEYAGSTGSFTTTTSQAYDGTTGVESTSGSLSGIEVSDPPFSSGPITASVWMYDTGGLNSGLALVEPGGGGYVAQNSDQGIKVQRFNGIENYDTNLTTGSGSWNTPAWIEIELTVHSGTVEGVIRDSGGNSLVGPLSASDSTYGPTTLGLNSYDSGAIFDLLTAEK
jgi:hypothetical protein